MSQFNLADYQQRFSHVKGVCFLLGKGSLPVIRIENNFCTTEVSLHGGQVLSYKRHSDTSPLLFCSADALFEAGRGIKGAPICWPWFGDDPEGRGAHGFARSVIWDIDNIFVDENQDVVVQLNLPTTANKCQPEWSYTANLQTTIRCGESLSISLTTQNHSRQPLMLTQALHTYFYVSNSKNIFIEGLESSSYLDKVQGFARVAPTGKNIAIQGEVDRIYDHVEQDIVLVDNNFNRQIMISSEGSSSAVVWNPWVEKAKLMLDFADHEYQNMVCIETANAGEDTRKLMPGESHTLTARYNITDIPNS